MKRDFYTTPKSTRLMRFLWSAAGGDRYILERATYSDQVKYMCLGGIITATGLMAALAGGYAFYTIFEPKGSAIDQDFSITVSLISILFGCLWGLMIFNLDRFIVSSTGKGDGTEAITWDELKGALPRIAMGAIIAITISKPVEIRMFKSEIDVELHNAQMEKQREYLANIDSIFAGRIESENKKIQTWQQEITAKETDYTNAVNDFNNELAEKPGGSTSGYGPDAKKKEAIKDDRKLERDAMRDKNSPLIEAGYSNLKAIEDEKRAEIDNGKVVAAGLDGLLERIKLSHEIAGTWITLFITLLFMAIELTPIFFKLMLIKSPYDFLKDNIEELMKAEQGIYIQANYYKDKNGQERDLITHLNKEKIISEKRSLQRVQDELTEYAIAKYKDEMIKKIDENPELYIKVKKNNDPENES
jgi:hypothetical protein